MGNLLEGVKGFLFEAFFAFILVALVLAFVYAAGVILGGVLMLWWQVCGMSVGISLVLIGMILMIFGTGGGNDR